MNPVLNEFLAYLYWGENGWAGTSYWWYQSLFAPICVDVSPGFGWNSTASLTLHWQTLCVMWHFLSHMDSLHRFGSYSLTQVHYSSGSGLILNLGYFLRHSSAFLYTLAVFYLKCRGWFRATLAWLIILTSLTLFRFFAVTWNLFYLSVVNFQTGNAWMIMHFQSRQR